MSGRVAGKVALITGAARGQGRSHALALAREGADIIAVDLCEDIESTAYPLARPDDLAATVKEIEALDRRVYHPARTPSRRSTRCRKCRSRT
jgi:(-)-trans-carveol dehydrogenase